jgi:alkylated DNA nucleotide flippase Atl1
LIVLHKAATVQHYDIEVIGGHMSDRATAVVKLARTISEALLTFAGDLEAATGVPDIAVDNIDIAVGRGQRQQQILEVPGLAAEAGLKTAEVAAEINYEVPNTHGTLQALERGGLVEMIPGATPQRWRLAARYRTTGPVFMRVASRVREGEWTTYGDISIAVRGDTKAARGVGRAAAALPQFPHPERVLMEGGLINASWHDSDDRGPDHCRSLLEAQGIRFIDERADPAQRVAWDELRRRDETEPIPSDSE